MKKYVLKFECCGLRDRWVEVCVVRVFGRVCGCVIMSLG